MDTAVLLTYDGESHPAYQRGSLFDDAVTGYLLNGNLPSPNTVCSSPASRRSPPVRLRIRG